MMEDMDRFWEDDDGERMRKASNAYDDSILTLADAIRFALEYDRYKIYIINDFKLR